MDDMSQGNLENWNIAENLAEVQGKISAAALRVNREPDEVRLIAVSKSQSVDKIREAYAVGLRDFGENRALEAVSKQKELADLHEIQWHMIGHIQSRKTRYLVPNFAMVHSIDRLKIARRLDLHCGEIKLTLPVLLECNVSGEETKGGWDLADRKNWPGILPKIREILELPNLDVRGVMMMAPFGAEEDVLRSVFRRLRELKEFLSDNLPATWDELSMGMTDDFEIAIEEGATLVRIGRAIFGPRDSGKIDE
jgi:pyridoxal phosphate enzyme (YggS family)